MSLSNILPGKANSIEKSGGGVDRATERVAHAPMFARPGEPEPGAVKGECLQPGEARPAPVPTFTGRDANALGMPQPEVDSQG
jgi:hypothetical protein